MYILTGFSNEWLSDEIVNSCCRKYTEFVAGNSGNFGRYIPPFVFQSLLQHLHPSTNLKSSRSKTQQDTLDESQVYDAYLYSKALWVYHNIFDDPKAWFFSIINYPNQKHWIHIGIHASEHKIIVYDPLRNKSNTDIVGSVVRAYANCDFAAALEQQKAGTSEIPNTGNQTCPPGAPFMPRGHLFMPRGYCLATPGHLFVPPGVSFLYFY